MPLKETGWALTGATRLGLMPNVQWLPAEIKRDKYGFIVTQATLETSMRGVFAVGDVRQGSTRQAASAVGEGATAALMIREYFDNVTLRQCHRGDEATLCGTRAARHRIATPAIQLQARNDECDIAEVFEDGAADLRGKRCHAKG